MSSIAHLQATFTRSADLLREDIDVEAAMDDMLAEKNVLKSGYPLHMQSCLFMKPESVGAFKFDLLASLPMTLKLCFVLLSQSSATGLIQNYMLGRKRESTQPGRGQMSVVLVDPCRGRNGISCR